MLACGHRGFRSFPELGSHLDSATYSPAEFPSEMRFLWEKNGGRHAHPAEIVVSMK